MATLRCLGPFSPSPRSLVKALLPLLLVYRVLEISRIRGNHSSKGGRQAVRQRLRAAERREQLSTRALPVARSRCSQAGDRSVMEEYDLTAENSRPDRILEWL
jgi:hypothetical protein